MNFLEKALFRDPVEFREWQACLAREVTISCQKSVFDMPLPTEYPFVVCWRVTEVRDLESESFEMQDKLQYEYVYLADFPVKNIKRGDYVYQVFHTENFADV